jgi:hypothetical protein
MEMRRRRLAVVVHPDGPNCVFLSLVVTVGVLFWRWWKMDGQGGGITVLFV